MCQRFLLARRQMYGRKGNTSSLRGKELADSSAVSAQAGCSCWQSLGSHGQTHQARSPNRALLQAPDRQPWPWNDQGKNKFRTALWNEREEAIKLLWLKWGKERVACDQWGEIQNSFHLSTVIWIWLCSYLQVNTQGILDSKDMTIHHGNSCNYGGEKADKSEEEKETRGLDGFFFSSKDSIPNMYNPMRT